MSDSAVWYDSAGIYIQSATTLEAKIVKIEAIITALEDIALTAAGTGNIDEYSLDDGQTKIKSTYRNTTEILEAIMGFERVRQMYVNRFNNRMFRLVDHTNFPGNGRFF